MELGLGLEVSASLTGAPFNTGFLFTKCKYMFD